MATNKTIKQMNLYIQDATTTRFLSGMFQSPRQNFHDSEFVDMDIQRGDEDIAIVINDLSANPNSNTDDEFTNKEFKPPILNEIIVINAFDLLKRVAGENTYQNPRFQAAVIKKMLRGMKKLQAKIQRTIELQASQVLQTGIIDLKNLAGVTLYTIDYKPKGTHFPTVTIDWDLVTSTKFADINSLANVLRNDGLEDPDMLVFGENAIINFMSDDKVKSAFDTRNITVGDLGPTQKFGSGGIFHGFVDIGNYKYQVWSYGGRFINPDGGAKEQYVDPDNMIMRSANGRLDLTFGSIPNLNEILGLSKPIIPALPRRMKTVDGGADMFANVYVSQNGRQMFGEIGTRPLCIPTAIDTFGTLKTMT